MVVMGIVCADSGKLCGEVKNNEKTQKILKKGIDKRSAV
jgi:hypothetical protein